MKTHSVFRYFKETYQTSLSYALPNKEPAGHFYAHNRIYGSLQEYQNEEGFFKGILCSLKRMFWVYQDF